jgi:hypothetical protein
MRKSTLFLGVILLGLAAVPGPLPGAAPLYAPASPPFTELAAEGVARALVVVPDDAPREMRRAAEELATYVRRISGAQLKIAAEPGDGAAVVLEVDPGLHPRPAGKRDWPGARGYRLRTEGQRLRVTETLFHRYGLNYYVAAKLAWNTRLDIDALLADYADHAFGPAAEPMLAHFRRLEQAMVDADCCLSYGLESPQRWGPRVFTAEVLDQAAAFLAQARSAAPEGPYRERVDFVQKGFDEAREGLTKLGAGK